MAQKPQLRSHPSAIFTYAHGDAEAGRGRLSRSKVGTGALVTGISERRGEDAGPANAFPKPATVSISGSAAASSSP